MIKFLSLSEGQTSKKKITVWTICMFAMENKEFNIVIIHFVHIVDQFLFALLCYGQVIL